jgi:FkbM family methyltransferase
MTGELSKQEIKDLIGIENPIILDVGAYDGKDGRELAMLFDNPKVWCFEPITHIEPFKNGHIVRMAVCDINGRLKLYTSEHMQSSSLRKPKAHLDIFLDVQFDVKPIEVDCVTLDVWSWINYEHDIIDFIWCDVNGSEGDFIKGARETLRRTRFLYIEFSDKELYEGQVTKSKLIDMLPEYWQVIGTYNFKGNFGNVLLKNTTL